MATIMQNSSDKVKMEMEKNARRKAMQKRKKVASERKLTSLGDIEYVYIHALLSLDYDVHILIIFGVKLKHTQHLPK